MIFCKKYEGMHDFIPPTGAKTMHTLDFVAVGVLKIMHSFIFCTEFSEKSCIAFISLHAQGSLIL